MPTCKQGWCKRIVTVLLALYFITDVYGQAETLLPEFDVSNGLPSNSVRCLKLDKSKRLWVGTDNGLSVINGNENHKKIESALSQKSIWSLSFLDSLVFVGTRYNGLFVFNQFTGSLSNTYPTSSINQIRKIKVFNNQDVYILTNEGIYKWANHVLAKLNVEEGLKQDFIIDIFQWDGKIVGLTNTCRRLILTDKNKFSQYEANAPCYFSAITSYNTLYLGGVGSKETLCIISKDKPMQKIDMPKVFGISFAAWEMVHCNGKLILGFGDTRTNEAGALCILDSGNNTTQVTVTDYVSCLDTDSATNTLYYGTLNKGVFVQRGLSAASMFNKPPQSTIIANGSTAFCYTNTSLQKIDNGNSETILRDFSNDNPVISMSIDGDTLIALHKRSLDVYVTKSLQLIKHFDYKNIWENGLSSSRLDNTVFAFHNYGVIRKFGLIKPATQFKQDEAFLPYPQRFGKQIFCLNKEKGFSIIEEDTNYYLKCSDSSIAFVNDFTVIQNMLYTLSSKELKAFQINYKSKELLLQNTTLLSNQTIGFYPKWLLTYKDRLYLLNEKGIVKFNLENRTPANYYYFGNYQQTIKPIITGDSLLLVSNSYLTRFPFTDFEKQFQQFENEDWKVAMPESVNENLGFQINIHSPNYLLQNHSLKQLEVWHRGELVQTLYTVTGQFNFPDGLKYGDYEFKISIGDVVKKQPISISLPLNRNPYFFGAILLFVLVVAAILFKTTLDKRKTKKQLLENRLQILKQNFNPHFVYNSMNLISSLILEGKNDEAVQVVADFSKLQRSYLETNNKAAINLTEELNYLTGYLDLQQKRFEHDNSFTYSINVSEPINTDVISLPPLILQPIAENAIKYGIVGSNATNKSITIDIKGINPTIISIEDNGNYAVQNAGFGMGEKFVKERLEIFAKTKNKSIIVSFGNKPAHSNTGYRVEISIG